MVAYWSAQKRPQKPQEAVPTRTLHSLPRNTNFGPVPDINTVSTNPSITWHRPNLRSVSFCDNQCNMRRYIHGLVHHVALLLCSSHFQSNSLFPHTMHTNPWGKDEQLHKLHDTLGMARMLTWLIKSASQYRETPPLEHPSSLHARLSCTCVMSTAHSRHINKNTFPPREWFKLL